MTSGACSRLPARGCLHPDEVGAPLVDSTQQTVSWAQSAGAIISSPAYLNTFVTALMRGRPLTPRMLEAMTTVTPTDATNTRFYGRVLRQEADGVGVGPARVVHGAGRVGPARTPLRPGRGLDPGQWSWA